VLWDLLDTGHFRKARTKRIVDFDKDLGYVSGAEPYAIQYQLQAMQMLISPLGYTLIVQPSSRSAQYVDLVVQAAPSAKAAKKSRRLAGGIEYKPGQGLSAIGNLQLPGLTLKAGGPSGVLGSGSYAASFLGLSANANAGLSLQRNRLLDGVKVNERSVTQMATVGWQPWRALDGNSLAIQWSASHAVDLNQNLNTIEPAVQFTHNDLASQYPSRTHVETRVVINSRFAICQLTANTHRSFDRWEYDVTGKFENAFGDPPIFELPSLGGADTVRGFRADDAIGRRLWSAQSELWHGLPVTSLLKVATFFDLGGASRTTGSRAGLRAGPGTGLRLDLHVAVLKLDWAYGFGQAATGGSRGKFYFNVTIPNH
jgi:hypothetical protein